MQHKISAKSATENHRPVHRRPQPRQSEHAVLALQRQVGNQTVQRLIAQRQTAGSNGLDANTNTAINQSVNQAVTQAVSDLNQPLTRMQLMRELDKVGFSANNIGFEFDKGTLDGIREYVQRPVGLSLGTRYPNNRIYGEMRLTPGGSD